MICQNNNTKYRTMDLYFIAVAFIAFAVTVESCPPQCRSCAGGTADCMGVGLRDIPRNFPSETVTIDLTDNQLTDIQQSDFPVQSNVQNLRLSRNGLSAIAPRTFSNMERLMSLDLSLNPITRVHDKSFEGLSKLRSLTLTNTKLRKLGKPFNEIPNVSSLYLGYNQLEQIEEDDFEMITRVRSIDLSANRIQSIHPRAFENLPYLRYLILKNNPIMEAKGLQFTSSMLQLLDFSQCNLVSVPGPMPSSVADFRLGNNEITEIKVTDFENITNLQLLTLIENKISKVEYMAFSTNINLQELWLNSNNLKMIPRGLPIRLEKLYMDQNEVHDIESGLFGKDANLETLSLNMNAVRQILSDSFSGLKNLTNILLKSNSIQEIRSGTFTDMLSLKKLDLSNNPLKKILPNAFNDLPSLQDLDMSYQEQTNVSIAEDFLNGIKTVQSLQFMNSPGLAKSFLDLVEKNRGFSFPSLKVVNLEYNELETLPSNLKDALVSLEMMTLDGNPLECDRRLLWLRNWMKKSEIKFYSFEAPKCSGPKEVNERDLESLKASEFGEAPKSSKENNRRPAPEAEASSGNEMTTQRRQDKKPNTQLETSTETRGNTQRQQYNTMMQNKDATTGGTTTKIERVQGTKTSGQIEDNNNNAARKTTGKNKTKDKKRNKKNKQKKKRDPKKNRKRRQRKKGSKRGKRKISRKCTKLPTGERRCCRKQKDGSERCRIIKPRAKKPTTRARKPRKQRRKSRKSA